MNMELYIGKIISILSDIPALADILSIAGFFITLISFYFILQVKKNILFRSNLTTYEKDINKISKEITDLLSNYKENLENIYDLIIRVDAKLMNLEKGSKSGLLTHIKETRKKIKKYKNKYKDKNNTEGNVREIKTQLTIIVDELNIQKKFYLIGAN